MSKRAFPPPYVGPRPFESADAGLFHGRDRETHELRSLLLSHRSVLLYGASGTGKTSLLAAGLLPRFVDAGFDVLPVGRLARSATSQPVSGAGEGRFFTSNLMASWNLAPPSEAAKMSVMDGIRRRKPRLDRYGDPVAIIGVVDQAEEMFTAGAHRVSDRTNLLTDLRAALDGVPNLHLLIGLREDFLAAFIRLAELAAFGQHGRHHLLPLLPKPAVEAVEGPIKGSGRRYAPGVPAQIVDLLRTATVVDENGAQIILQDEFVEPVQLQVVCERLWHSIPHGVDVITDDMVRSFGDVDQALGAFYDDAVGAVADSTNIAASRIRRWVEEAFITDVDTRGAVNEGRSMTRGMPNAVPRGLEDRHVLRAESRARARWYELSHDRLIEVIRRSNRASLRSPAAARAKDAEDNLAWAEHLLDRGMYEEAEQYAVTARDLYAASGDQWAAANAVAFLGDIAAARGPEFVDEALAVYLEAGQRLREIHDDQALCRVLTARGRLLLDRGRLEEAAVELAEAVAVDPSSLEAAENLALYQWYSGAYEQAVAGFTAALRVEPLSLDALNGRGQLLADLGRPAEALADLDLLLSLGPDVFTEAYARSARALALDGLGRPAEADRDLALALDFAPDNAWAHLRRAKIRARRGQIRAAMDSLRVAMASQDPALTDAQRSEANTLLTELGGLPSGDG